MSEEESRLQMARERSNQDVNMWRLDPLLCLLLPHIKGNITGTKLPCDENQGRLFKLMDRLMERRSDPILPLSLSDADLASSFSNFFSEKITGIRCELDLDLCPCVFSMDNDVRLRMITTILSYFEHKPLQKLKG